MVAGDEPALPGEPAKLFDPALPGAPAVSDEPALPDAPAAAEDVLDLAGMGLYVEADEAAEDAAHAQAAEAGNDALVGTETISSISESLAALAMMAQPPAAPQIVRSGETSLEGMVRDLLRPELAAWLDKNLPALVEKLVAAEIARIVGKKS